MSFFQKLGNAFSRFMYGRNGSDQLGWASIVLLLVLNTVNLFMRSGSETVHTILSTASLLLMVWILFRMFSRNLLKRRKENAWFLTKIYNPLRAMIKLPCIYGQRETKAPDAHQEESTRGKI